MIGVFEIRQGSRVKTVEIVYGGDKSAAKLADEIYSFLVENVVELFGLAVGSELGKAQRMLLESGGNVIVQEVRGAESGHPAAVFEISKDGRTKRLDLVCNAESSETLASEIYGFLVSQEKVKGWVN